MFPQKYLVPKSTPFLEKKIKQTCSRTKNIIITVEERVRLPENNRICPVCSGRNDGAPANDDGGANDPVDVKQSFSAGHFCRKPSYVL